MSVRIIQGGKAVSTKFTVDARYWKDRVNRMNQEILSLRGMAYSAMFGAITAGCCPP